MSTAAIKTAVRVLVIPLEPDNEPYAIIPLHGKYGQGLVAKVSLEDVARVRRYRWYVNAKGYAYTYGRTEAGKMMTPMLHRFVYGLMPGDRSDVFVDHEGHDPLDNRRSKTRLCDNSQNQRNRKNSRNALRGGYKGVKQIGKTFMAIITCRERI
jgi:hypothetical protein